jgi:hypothetical protein
LRPPRKTFSCAFSPGIADRSEEFQALLIEHLAAIDRGNKIAPAQTCLVSRAVIVNLSDHHADRTRQTLGLGHVES